MTQQPQTTHNRRKQIFSGVVWNALNLFVTKGLSIVVRLLLARLLFPEDFGLVAILIVALGLAKVVVDLGLKNALIQRARDGQSARRYSSAFWFLSGFGLITSIIFAVAIAPLLATAFAEPQLVELALFMSWSILFHSISIVPLVRLTRRLMFRRIVIAEIIAVLAASVVAIALAYFGFGVLSLALQQVVLFFCKSVALFVLSGWRPRLAFSSDSLRDIVEFSAYTLGVKIIQYLRTRSDMLIVGFVLGTVSLGLYSMAYAVTEVVRSSVSTMVNKLLLPVFSQLQSDEKSLARMFNAATQNMTLLVFPISISIYLHADWMVGIAFTEEWYGIIAPVEILAWSGIIYAMGGPVAELFQAGGKPDRLFWLLITNFAVIALPLTIYLTYRLGLSGTAYAVVASMIILRLRMHFTINGEFPSVSQGIVRALLPALATMAACFAIDTVAGEQLPVWIKIGTYFILYYGQMLWGFRQFLSETRRVKAL